MRLAPLVLLATLAVVSGCQDIAPPEFRRTQSSAVSCGSDSDCGGGRCDVLIARCVAERADFPGVLLEVVPEATDSGFGGFHILRTLRQLEPRLSSPGNLELIEPPRVSGRVNVASVAGGSCDVPASVRITLKPRDTYLGLDLPSYSTVSEQDVDKELVQIVHSYALEGVPLGTYDVYWEDAGLASNIAPGCEIVPQVFRGIQINQALDLPLTQPPFRPLRVVVPWGEDDLLEGWTVDVVHATTGERLSTESVLSAALLSPPPTAEPGVEVAAAEQQVAVDIKVSSIFGEDYLPPAERELLRLRPPAQSNLPTLFFSLWILEAFMTGQAAVPALRPFSAFVNFQAWVWEANAPGTAVPGRVEFTATELLDAQGAGFYAFALTRSVDVDEQGQIAVDLPPGVYRARVVPRASSAPIYETTVRIWAGEEEPSPAQAGRVLAVPQGAVVSGRIRLPLQMNPEGTAVRVTGLGDALGVAAFRPRSSSTLAGQEGRFRLTGVDCKGCEDRAPAQYSLLVVPPSQLGLPWALRSPLVVSEELDLGTIDVGLPQVHFGQLAFRKANGSTGAFPGALIRAYVLLDRQGRVLPPDAERCLARALPLEGEELPPCAQSTLQVAGVRSAADGSFRLYLPAKLSAFGQ